MQEERLFRRIARWEREPQRRVGNDPRRIIDSVTEHLQLILNTRQGSVPIGEEFGLPDFVELFRNYPESLREFERSIRSTIQKYEPRLKAVRVRLLANDEDPLSLRFQISAKLDSLDRRVPVVLESTVGQDGRVSVAQ